jgi:hypothetical protein
VIRAGSGRVAPVAPGKVVDCKDAYLNAFPKNWPISGALLCARSAIDSAASSRGRLPQRPRAGLHARPARRPFSSCRHRAGLVASRNLAFDPPAPAAQTHTSRPLGQPHRDSISLHLEMAFRSAERPSREMSNTGLRPVGRAAVATLETGLRPVRSAPTRYVVRDLHHRPARRPVSGCRRRAGLVAHRNVALGLVAPPAQTHTPETVTASIALEPPHRQSPSLHFEMASQSSKRSSRETSKTGLRPVGRAAVATFETGLRPVKRAPTERVAISSPEPFRPGATPPRVSRWTTHHLRRDHRPTNTGGATLGAHSGDLETRRDFRGIPSSTRALFLPATLTFFRDGPPNKRLVSDRAGRCAPVPAAQPQGVGGMSVLVSRGLG